MDNKYGKLYNRDDVFYIVQSLLEKETTTEELWKAIDEYEGKLSGDMPVFTLLAQDKRAISAIKYYLDHQSPGAPPAHLNLVEKTMNDFDDWRIDHPGTMKNPD